MNNRNTRLAEGKISSLLMSFAVPSIIAMMVSSLYNMVDQFFIGRTVGPLGNAATNIQFPLSTACMAIALLCGIGGAAAFNLAMGRSEFDSDAKRRAADYMGNAVVMMITGGLILFVITLSLSEPLLRFFGSPEDVLPYALSYTKIVAFGYPFLIVSVGSGHLIRADGRPNAAMTCNLTGAAINTVLDAVFLLKFGWGMQGAALATVIGQVAAGSMAVRYLYHAKTVKLSGSNFRLKAANVRQISSLGTAQSVNQISMMIVQIVLNNSLKFYGAASSYGESVPIAVVGIISKVNMIFMAIVIGISHGMQPIVSYNYGSRRYDRVKKTFVTAISYAAVVSVVFFLTFQLIPRQIISIFGEGSPEYFEFAIRYFRIYLFFTFANFLQPMTSTVHAAIGKPKVGTFLSLTRQIIFLLPLIVLLPRFMGIDGILYAGPIADGLAFVISAVMAAREFRRSEYRTKKGS